MSLHVPSTAALAPRPSGASPSCPVPSPPGQARRSAGARPAGRHNGADRRLYPQRRPRSPRARARPAPKAPIAANSLRDAAGIQG